MLKLVNTFLQKRTLREQIFLCLFLWAGVIFWGNAFVDRASELKETYTQVSAIKEYQELWVSNEPSIQVRLKEALQKFDPKRTYTRNQFIARVDSIARDIGANYDISNPTTSTNDIFEEHALAANFKNASMQNVIDFDQAISAESPYLNIKSVKISPNSSDPSRLNVRFDIIALELKNFKDIQGLTQTTQSEN